MNLKNKTIIISLFLGIAVLFSTIYAYNYFNTENNKLKAVILEKENSLKLQKVAYQDTLKYYHLLENIQVLLLERKNEDALELFSQLDKRFIKIALDSSITHFVYSLKKDSTYNDSISQVMIALKRNLMLSNIALNRNKENISTQKGSIDSLEQKLITTVLYANQQQLLNTQLKEEIEQVKASYGKLTFKTEDGKEVLYYGEIVEGKAGGYGIGIFDGKSIYEGEWKNGVRHGIGKYKWKNEDTYEGQYVKGKRQGFGKYTFATGERYEGEWENDLRNGKGKLYDKEGKVLIEGKWIADKYDKNSNPKKDNAMK